MAKRPGLDAFLNEMAQLYEVVIFTDSMGGLADEVSTPSAADGGLCSPLSTSAVHAVNRRTCSLMRNVFLLVLAHSFPQISKGRLLDRKSSEYEILDIITVWCFRQSFIYIYIYMFESC